MAEITSKRITEIGMLIGRLRTMASTVRAYYFALELCDNHDKSIIVIMQFLLS